MTLHRDTDNNDCDDKENTTAHPLACYCVLVRLAGSNEQQDTADADPQRGNKTTINLYGYRYTKAWASITKMVYRCSQYRSTGYRGKAEFIAQHMGYTVAEPYSYQNEAEVVPDLVNATSEMAAAAGELAISNIGLTAQQI